MNLEGSFTIKCPRTQVWKFISDPQQIARCLPDIQHLEVKDEAHFSVTVKVGIAFVRGTFKFDFTLLDQAPPSHSKFEAVGKGAGVSIKLQAVMDLSEAQPTTTQLSWKAEAQLGGLLSEVSSSLIQGSTDKFTREFFECIKAKLENSP